MYKVRSLLFIYAALLFCVRSLDAQWSVSFDPSNDSLTYNFVTVSASDANNCTAAGYFTNKAHNDGYHTFIVRTTDGGDSWNFQKNDFTKYTAFGAQIIYKVFSLDSLNVVAVGDSSLILRTTDGGNTWTTQHSTNSWTYLDVHFSDSSNGIAVGNAGHISITTDAGKTWLDQPVVEVNSLVAAHAFEGGSYCAFQYSGNYEATTNGGSSWDSSVITTLRDRATNWSRTITSAKVVTRSRIVAAGLRDSSGYEALAFLSTDGGVHWKQTLDSLTIADGEFLSVDFADSLFGIGATRNHYFYVSMNGGMSWGVDTVLMPTTARQNKFDYMGQISFGGRRKAFACESWGTYGFLVIYNRPSESVGFKTVAATQGMPFPNPGIDGTSISFNAKGEQPRTVVIFNSLGQAVWKRSNVRGGLVHFDRGSSPSGVYYYRVSSGDLPTEEGRFILR